MHYHAVLAAVSLLGLTSAAAVSDTSLDVPFKVVLSAARLQELEALSATNGTLVARQGSCTFQAFSGNTCNAPSGAVITNPRGCIDTRDRHSFFVSSGCGGGLRVSIQENTGCPGGNNGGTYNSGCYNVNTGRAWRSSYVSN